MHINTAEITWRADLPGTADGFSGFLDSFVVGARGQLSPRPASAAMPLVENARNFCDGHDPPTARC